MILNLKEKKLVCSSSFGVDVQFGLTDFISTMSQPSWVWENGMDFPKLYSWDRRAREEIFSLFNYNDALQFRATLDLESPNFENFSLPLLCKSDLKNTMGLSNYCEVAQNLPDIGTTLNLMSWANHPTNFDNFINLNLQ